MVLVLPVRTKEGLVRKVDSSAPLTLPDYHLYVICKVKSSNTIKIKAMHALLYVMFVGQWCGVFFTQACLLLYTYVLYNVLHCVNSRPQLSDQSSAKYGI